MLNRRTVDMSQQETASTITRLQQGQKWLATEYETLLQLGINGLGSEQETIFSEQLMRWADMESLLRITKYEGCIWGASSCDEKVSGPNWVGRCSHCAAAVPARESVQTVMSI
jgi:hypothetical protein